MARSRAIGLDGFFRHQQPWSSRLHGFFQRLDVGVGVMVLQDVALGREHGIKKKQAGMTAGSARSIVAQRGLSQQRLDGDKGCLGGTRVSRLDSGVRVSPRWRWSSGANRGSCGAFHGQVGLTSGQLAPPWDLSCVRLSARGSDALSRGRGLGGWAGRRCVQARQGSGCAHHKCPGRAGGSSVAHRRQSSEDARSS